MTEGLYVDGIITQLHIKHDKLIDFIGQTKLLRLLDSSSTLHKTTMLRQSKAQQ